MFKAYKARAARGTGLQPQALLADENVQYLSKFSVLYVLLNQSLM